MFSQVGKRVECSVAACAVCASLLATPAAALDYNAYDHYSFASCIKDYGTADYSRFLCDIPTGTSGHSSSSKMSALTANTLTGVTVYLFSQSGDVTVSVCGRNLSRRGDVCVNKKPGDGSIASIVFERRDLSPIVKLSPWYNQVLYLKVVYKAGPSYIDAFEAIGGYKVFWKL